MLHLQDTGPGRGGGHSQMSDRPHKRLSGKTAMQCLIVSFSMIMYTSICIQTYSHSPTRFSLLCRVKNEFVICKRCDMFAKKANLIHSPPFWSSHAISGPLGNTSIVVRWLTSLLSASEPRSKSSWLICIENCDFNWHAMSWAIQRAIIMSVCLAYWSIGSGSDRSPI